MKNSSASGRDRLEAYVVAILGVSLSVYYAYLFYRNISKFWFNPRWTSDDALQQLFPLHSVWHPEIFQGDLIFTAMTGYLAPIHWWMSYAITLVTKNPIMTGHWMMLVQLLLTLIPLAIGVWSACRGPRVGQWIAALAPGALAAAWFLHARPLVQRLTAGLPRGWAAPLFAVYFMFLLRGNHRAVIATLACSALINPPAAFLIGFSYGMYLLYLTYFYYREHRSIFYKPLVELVIATPFIAIATLMVTARPPEIGKLASLSEAEKMPEFSRAGGRFSFLPFLPPADELADYAFRSVASRIYTPTNFWRTWTKPLFGGLMLMLLLSPLVLKREIIPVPIIIFGVCAIITYFLSRVFAFHLYVPDRHLTFPVGMFMIVGGTIGTFRLFSHGSMPLPWIRGALGLSLVITIIFGGSEWGLQSTEQGTANFNYHDRTRGGVYNWIRKNTKTDAYFAGNPIHLDPVHLYGMRRAFVTHETWHPFYENYNNEMKRRNEISLRAHYSRDFEEFFRLLEPEKIDYFVFERAMFKPHRLAKAHFNQPFTQMVKELTSFDRSEFVALKVPVDNKAAVPYFDEMSILVDMKELKKWYESQRGVAKQ